MGKSSRIKRDLYECLDALKQPDADQLDPYKLILDCGLVTKDEAEMPVALRQRLQKQWDTQSDSLNHGYSKEEWALADQAFHDYTENCYLLSVVARKAKAAATEEMAWNLEDDTEPNIMRLVGRLEKLMTSLVTRGMVRAVDEHQLPCGQSHDDVVRFAGKVIRHTLDAMREAGMPDVHIYPVRETAPTTQGLLRQIEWKPDEYSQWIKDSPDIPRGR